MTFAESLVIVIAARPRGTIHHNLYLHSNEAVWNCIEEIGHSWDNTADIGGCEKVAAVLGWCMDALYNYGAPDDIGAFPPNTDEVDETVDEAWTPF